MAKKIEFPGFPLGMMRFYEELSRNNNRAWFNKNKPRYEKEVREPALAFITAMQKPLAKVSPHFTAVPKKVGGSLMRLHRDVRFSKNKTPYKTNLGIQFRHEVGKDVHAPGFYFHVDLNEVFLGAGSWHPASEELAAYRAAIDNNPTRWKRIGNAKRFRENWKPEGESLKRPPRGYPADHPMIDELKRKDHIALMKLDHEVLLSPDLLPMVIDSFKRAKPYLAFLCDAIGQPI